MKPMLLERKNPDVHTLPYPLFISPKLDGIRCLLTAEGPKTRTLKPIPNKLISQELNFMSLKGLDGELIVGPPNAADVFNATTRGVRNVRAFPDYKYYAFDFWDQPETPYGRRLAELEYFTANLHPRIVFLPSTLVDSPEELLAEEERLLNDGYEGVIIRIPGGLYKYGRTTMKELNAYKLKRFEDAEAYVIGMVPKYHNANEAFTNELGRTARSKKASGLVALETMGALELRDVETGVEFQCGSGFSDDDRLWWYLNYHRMMADKALVTYKKFLVGEKDKPRHPIFKGVRMRDDV
jgi:DNA ligase-1